MSHSEKGNRRKFMQGLVMLGVGSQALVRSGDLKMAIAEAQEAPGNTSAWPGMSYRKLGRTNFEASRLVFGCGATLSRSPKDHLLETAFRYGVNVFDVGYRSYYNNAETNMAPFLKKHRDDIFLISKARLPHDLGPHEEISVADAKAGAAKWLQEMESSLKELKVEHVDAYYLMAIDNPSILGSEEVYRTFQVAQQAGKVSYLGLSSHHNTENVLRMAIKRGWYDLAQIAITPGGWYDWKDKTVLEGSPTMAQLQPFLKQCSEAGIGLIGMKAGRFLAGRKFMGWGNPSAFDEHYDEKILAAKLSDFQRSYAFVLEHGLDAVNADMQNMLHLRENFAAAAQSSEYFV